jgi:glycosyltransferase involved in cell wall biosynthesis
MADTDLKVLLLARKFEVRGSCAYTLRLAEHLESCRISSIVVTPDARLVEPGRRQALRIKSYSQLGFPIWRRVARHQLFRDLSEDKPDLIHVQSRAVLPLGTWLASQLERPFVLSIHDYLQPRERLNFDRTWGRKIIAVSDSVKSELIRRTHLDDAMVVVIHPGVEVPDELAAVPVLDLQHVPVVGTAGPLEAVKGLPYFLGAAQRVLASHRDVEFLVSGAGPEESNLRRLARNLGISEHITFVPNLYDFSESLAAMDIFCLPSLKQGLGTIMLDAMAFGRPVIASGVGGIYSVVRDNETGLIVPPTDSAELARRILELLNDPVRARAIGQAARGVVLEKFGAEQMVRRSADLYREVLADPCTQQSLPLAAN